MMLQLLRHHHNLDHSIVLKVEPIGDNVDDDQNTEQGPRRSLEMHQMFGSVG
jgi:hypothetical protein